MKWCSLISSGNQQSPTKRVFEHTLFLGGNKIEKRDALKGHACVVPIQRVHWYFLDIRISSRFSSLLFSAAPRRGISHHLLFSPAKTHIVHAHLLLTRNRLHSFFLLQTLHSNIIYFLHLLCVVSRSFLMPMPLQAGETIVSLLSLFHAIALFSRHHVAFGE